MTRTRENTDILGGGVHHALRRYVVARASGREHAEWARWEPEAKGWVGCTEIEAQGHPSYRVRTPGMPWCSFLGRDTTIAEDAELAAYFEAHVEPGFGFTPLRGQVSRRRRTCLREWKARGRELLDRARELRETPDIKPNARLAEEFAAPGKGLRSLKKARRD